MIKPNKKKIKFKELFLFIFQYQFKKKKTNSKTKQIKSNIQNKQKKIFYFIFRIYVAYLFILYRSNQTIIKKKILYTSNYFSIRS